VSFTPICISRGAFALNMRATFAVPHVRFGTSKFDGSAR
jgi:hypothetical protein